MALSPVPFHCTVDTYIPVLIHAVQEHIFNVPNFDIQQIKHLVTFKYKKKELFWCWFFVYSIIFVFLLVFMVYTCIILVIEKQQQKNITLILREIFFTYM